MLKDLDAFVKTMPQAGLQRLNGLGMALHILPHALSHRVVLLAGIPRRTSRTGKISQRLYDRSVDGLLRLLTCNNRQKGKTGWKFGQLVRQLREAVMRAPGIGGRFDGFQCPIKDVGDMSRRTFGQSTAGAEQCYHGGALPFAAIVAKDDAPSLGEAHGSAGSQELQA